MTSQKLLNSCSCIVPNVCYDLVFGTHQYSLLVLYHINQIHLLDVGRLWSQNILLRNLLSGLEGWMILSCSGIGLRLELRNKVPLLPSASFTVQRLLLLRT